MQRVNSIDYMRGLLAFSVMIYHFFSWSIGVPDSSTVLGRLGIYAVSTFYIISGISLYLVYSELKPNPKDISVFFTKRLFRIAPLYWVATLLTGFYLYLASPNFSVDWERYASNLTLIFGFYFPQNYIPVGGWSIGNEMVFYAMFPILVIAARRTWLFACASLVLGAIYFYYAFYALSPAQTLALQWTTYINPLNQAFLFTIGIGIALISKNHIPIKGPLPTILFIVSCIAFVFFPAEGNQINIVSGYNRVVFTLICGLACWSALNSSFTPEKHAAKIMKFLGDTSYSTYLLHGAVYFYTSKYALPNIYSAPSPQDKLQFFLLVSLPTTLAASYLIYRFIEKPFIVIGKRLTTRPKIEKTQISLPKHTA